MPDPTLSSDNAIHASSNISEVKNEIMLRMRQFSYFEKFKFYHYLRSGLADLISNIPTLRPPAVIIATDAREYGYDPLVETTLVVFGVIAGCDVFRMEDFSESNVEMLERMIVSSIDKFRPLGHVRVLARSSQFYDVSTELDVVGTTFSTEDN